MELASIVVSAAALLVSLAVARRQLGQERHSNQASVLIDLLREHRGKEMAKARRFVYREIGERDLSHGMDGLPEAEREAVRDLMCFYDILGVMVAYEVIDLDPIAGNLGGSVKDMWSALSPLVESERQLRQVSDPARWHWYFEYLASLVETHPPGRATVRLRPAGASPRGLDRIRAVAAKILP